MKQGQFSPIEDVFTDFASGVKLIETLGILGGEPVGRYNKTPKLRLQKIENMNIALDYIKRRGGIQLTNIGSEDIVDGNKKLILGLLWIIILRWTIADISEEGKTAKEGELAALFKTFFLFNIFDLRSSTLVSEKMRSLRRRLHYQRFHD